MAGGVVGARRRPKSMTASVHKAANYRNPAASWCVRWQSPNMPAPAFWYFADEATALEAARGLFPRLPRLEAAARREAQRTELGEQAVQEAKRDGA